LIEGLERIGAMMEWRWSLEGENEKEESKDDKKRSEDGPEKVKRRESYCLPFVRIVVLLIEFFLLSVI